MYCWILRYVLMDGETILFATSYRYKMIIKIYFSSQKFRCIIWQKNVNFSCNFSVFFFPFIFISWRLIALQDCSGFCHTLTWISHGFTCIPHPGIPSHLPLHPIPLGLPSAPGPSTCLMHAAWAGDLFHPR